MKKVTGYIDVRALGRYDFEFFVDDDMTDEEIRDKVDDICDYYIDWNIETGYVAKQQTVYVKE